MPRGRPKGSVNKVKDDAVDKPKVSDGGSADGDKFGNVNDTNRYGSDDDTSKFKGA